MVAGAYFGYDCLPAFVTRLSSSEFVVPAHVVVICVVGFAFGFDGAVDLPICRVGGVWELTKVLSLHQSGLTWF